MQLSEGVEWGTHCATLLALLPPGTSLPAARLAEYHDVPAAYLAKHLQAMARAGILGTERGPRGGYRLARPASEITLLEIVEAIDGLEPAFRCNEIRRRGPTASPARHYPTVCGIHAAMLRADVAWRAEIARTTVQELAEIALRAATPTVLEKGARWMQEVLA
jgi:Rrf2 family protein